MPINLPPQAVEAERRHRAAKSIEDKISTLEEYISLIPKHKGTDHLRADLRRRLSKLREAAQIRRGTGKQVSLYHIDKEGAGQVVLVGPPNVGKSALVNALTNASPEVAPYPYTTWTPTPGMMTMENIQIQLIDTPPLSEEYVEPEMLNLIRRCDLVLVVVDLQAFPIQEIEDTVAILGRHRIVPEHLGETYGEEQRVIFKPLLVLVNKCDDEKLCEDYQVLCELLEEEWPMLPVSATTTRNLEHLKRVVFDLLGVMRVYSKPPGKEPDFTAPFVLEKGSNVEDFAVRVHKDFYDNLKAARVWGSGTYEGQMVGRDHILHDGDIVELRV